MIRVEEHQVSRVVVSINEVSMLRLLGVCDVFIPTLRGRGTRSEDIEANNQ